MGFFRSMSTGWRFIKEAFGMARDNRALLKPSVYLVVVTIVYIALWIAAIIGVEVASEGFWEDNEGLLALLGALCTFGSFLIFYFFCGMTVNMVDVHLEGGEPSMKEAYRDARQNLGAIVWMAIVSTIVNMLANALRGDPDEPNIVGRIVAGIIESIWTVLTFLMLPAIIIEDISLREALKRVRALHKGHMLLIGVGEVGVRAVTGLIGFLVVLLIIGVVYLSLDGIGGTTGVVLALLVGGTLLAMFAAFSTFIRMAYYTCLYLWARDVEAKGKDAPAPLPLARTLRR